MILNALPPLFETKPGTIPAFKDEEGAFFIDRSGRVFEEILNWLRSGHIRVGPHASKEELIAEANFYLLPTLLYGGGGGVSLFLFFLQCCVLTTPPELN